MTEDDYRIAQMISESEGANQVLILMKYGFDYDVAVSLSDAERFAYVVIAKQMYENLVFLWDKKRWIVRPEGKVVAGRL